ncbi:MAG: Smr/MutS family protein, partial [Myxococcota bacterium]
MTDARDADEAVELPIDGVLDLHTFQPRDVKSLVPEYLDECRGRGIAEVRIIHGKGKGVLRRTVHAILERRTDVVEFGLAPAQRGGWGATLVTLDVGAAWAAESKGAERKGAESKAERTGEEETEIGTSTADTSAVGASAVGTAGADRLDSPNPLAERASGPQASGRMARVAKVVVRWLVTFAMVYVGVLHFVDPMPFVRIVPDYLPEP